ncbi:hypothetical protein H4Q26_018031 [Puccinia striiformis f. sp. tritici PST-130]|nr:hypothetical protein H4Q26_018031 [Puccinia striiformis f. sp. tritici PST-130]
MGRDLVKLGLFPIGYTPLRSSGPKLFHPVHPAEEAQAWAMRIGKINAKMSRLSMSLLAEHHSLCVNKKTLPEPARQSSIYDHGDEIQNDLSMMTMIDSPTLAWAESHLAEEWKLQLYGVPTNNQ